MLKMYFATEETYDIKKKYYKDHETEFNPDEWLFEKPSTLQSNFKVQIRQLAS